MLNITLFSVFVFFLICTFHHDSNTSYFTHILCLCLFMSSVSQKMYLCVLCVSTDERFPEYGKVEFVFSYGPEKIKGNPVLPLRGTKWGLYNM